MEEKDWYLQLMEKAKKDANYQTCLEEVKRLEPVYLTLRESLPDMQGRLLERYVTACEELDHALLLLAMQQK